MAVVTDNFDRANEDPLSNGGKWTTMAGAGDSLIVLTNQCKYGTGGVQNGAYWSANEFANDQSCQMVIATINVSDNSSACVRTQTDAFSFYAMPSSSESIKFRKVVNGAETQLGSTHAVAISAGNTVKLTVTGDTLEAFVEGVSHATQAGGGVFSSGHPGLVIYSAHILDNFEGGPLAVAASAAITGTATDSITEADVVAGGKIITITLTGDTWIAA